MSNYSFDKAGNLTLRELYNSPYERELIDNGIAEVTGNGDLYIQCADVPQLTALVREHFELPSLYPFDIYIRAEGLIHSEDFALKPRLQVNAPVGEILGSTVQGAFIRLADEREYLLSPEQFEIYNTCIIANAQLGKGYSRLGTLQSVLAKAENQQPSGVAVDDTIQKERIVRPTQLQLDVADDGKLTIHVDQTLGFDAALDRGRNVKSVYTIIEATTRGKVRVIIDESLTESLEKIKKWRRKSDTAPPLRELVAKPTAFFDPEIVNLDSLYSERVIEIAAYRPRFYPFIAEHQSTWIPGIAIDDDRTGRKLIPLRDFDALEELNAAISLAELTDSASVTYGGHDIPLEVAKATASSARRQLTDRTQRAQDVEPVELTKAEEQLVLVIHDNAEDLDHNLDASLDEKYKQTFAKTDGLAVGIALKEHQIAGVAWLQSLIKAKSPGALLADDMGLGKTLQILYFLEWHSKQYAETRPYLVVAPVALLENWAAEYTKFFPEGRLTIQRVASSEVPRQHSAEVIRRLSSASVTLTNYEALARGQLNFCAVDYAAVVLDEAQQIKNPGTLRTSAAKALKTDFRIAMTGTPVENTLMDLWSLMDFAVPGLVGTAKGFRQEYEAGASAKDEDVNNTGRRLRNRLGEFFLRRTKADVASDLPSKQELKQKVAMPKVQADTYYALLPREGEQFGGTDTLKLLLDMRKVAEHPALYASNWEKYPKGDLPQMSARMSATMRILFDVKAANEKAIVFALFRESQQMLAEVIADQFGFYPIIINGDTPTTASTRTRARQSRQQAIDSYSAGGGFNVIIMSPIAAGVGLNVTAANHVIHYSRHWNPAKENQATDRAYRIGQTRDVYVYYPIATLPNAESFDVVLDDLLSRKQALADGTLFPSAQAEVSQAEFAAAIGRTPVTQPHEDPRITLKQVDTMSGDRFEALIAAVMEKRGYTVHLTPITNDNGADVIALEGPNEQQFVIQAKRYSKIVPKGAVQEVAAAIQSYEQLLGVSGLRGLVASNQQLSSGAQALARSNKIDEMDRDRLETYLTTYFITARDLNRLEKNRLTYKQLHNKMR